MHFLINKELPIILQNTNIPKNTTTNVSASFINKVVVQIVVQMKKAATKKCLKTCL